MTSHDEFNEDTFNALTDSPKKTGDRALHILKFNQRLKDSEVGKLFLYHSDKNGKSFRTATAQDIAETNTIAFTGIDTNGMGYLMPHCNALSRFTKKDTMLTYQYSTPAPERAQDMERLYKNEGYFSAEAMDVAKRLFKDKFDKNNPDKLPKPTNIITHSFGGLFQKMVLNAMSQLALDAYDQDRDKARAFITTFNSVNIGIRPPWQSSKTAQMSPYLDIQRDNVEIYVAAYDDIIPFIPKYALATYVKFAEESKEEAPPYILTTHEGDSKHKYLFVISPKIIPHLVNGLINTNIGNHKLSHYIDALTKNKLLDKIMYRIGLLMHESETFKNLPIFPEVTHITTDEHHEITLSDKEKSAIKNNWQEAISRLLHNPGISFPKK